MTKVIVRWVLVAALAAPLAASAQTRTPSRTPATVDNAFRMGVLGGVEFADENGFGFRVDGEYDLMTLAEGVKLGAVGSLGWSNFSDDAFGIELSTNVFKLVPAARFTFPIADAFGIYADAGLGLYWARSEIDSNNALIPSDEDDAFGLTLRGAGGAYYLVSDQLRIGGELGVNPYFGDFDETTFNLFGMISFRF
jgi:hypothetical protein